MSRIKRTILNLLYAIDRNEHLCILTSDLAKAWTNGFNQGKSMAKMQWGIIPMPFTCGPIARRRLRHVHYAGWIRNTLRRMQRTCTWYQWLRTARVLRQQGHAVPDRRLAVPGHLISSTNRGIAMSWYQSS